MLQEKLRAGRVSELSAHSSGRPHSDTWVYPAVYLPLTFSTLCFQFTSLCVSATYFWLTGRHPYCHQTGG